MNGGFLPGSGVAVTRGEGIDGPLTSLLRGRGATVLDWGSIAFVPPDDLCPLLSALARLLDYDWICFSSPRAVDAVVRRVQTPPVGIRVAAVGPSTSAALKEAGWPVHRMPEEGSGEGLVRAFQVAGDVDGRRVFFPASAIAREVIPTGLSELGAQVDRRTAYQMVKLPLDEVACRMAVEAGEVHVVTFASPSAMEALREGIGEDLFRQVAEGIPAAVMGPTTGSALTRAGWTKITVARTPTLEGLADAATEAVNTNTESTSARRD